ncbi:hypothetical protein [Kribbella sp. NPDC050470]|uniref:hypothetical protein n=1 Tax=unclassified Kribbella TaxID=2644121 RepID=UPI00378C3344
MNLAEKYDVDPVFLSLLMDRLWQVRAQRITAPEQDAVDACLAAVRELTGAGQ